MAHLEGLFERLGENRDMNSHVVLSTRYEHRTVEAPSELPRPVTRVGRLATRLIGYCR